MRKPIFAEDITNLGVWYWIEVEGFEKMSRKQSGNFAFASSEIMGWGCQTIYEIWEKQREVNYAPRIRMWEGKDEPTAKERASGKWLDECRAWFPNWQAIRKNLLRYNEWCETGRTQWPKEG